MAEPIEKPKENPKEIAPDKRAALEALAARVQSQAPASAIKLRSDKPNALDGLRDLKQAVAAGNITSVTAAEINALHDGIDPAAILNPRPAEDMLQGGLDAFRSMGPNAKAGLLAGGGLLSVLGLRSFYKGARNSVLDGVDYAKSAKKKVVKGAQTAIAWIVKQAAFIGVSALAFMGLRSYMSAPKTETNNTAK